MARIYHAAALEDHWAWVPDAVQMWADRLDLGDWSIRIAVDRVPMGRAEAAAVCAATPENNEAVISFSTDLTDDIDGHVTIVHELLHVSHARIDQVVEDVIINAAPKAQRKSLKRVYNHVAYEPYVQRVATALVALGGITGTAHHAPKRRKGSRARR